MDLGYEGQWDQSQYGYGYGQQSGAGDQAQQDYSQYGYGCGEQVTTGCNLKKLEPKNLKKIEKKCANVYLFLFECLYCYALNHGLSDLNLCFNRKLKL